MIDKITIVIYNYKKIIIVISKRENTMARKTLTVKELFCGMSFLQNYFRDLEGKIRVFTPEEGKCEEVEKPKNKRKQLLATAKNMDIEDLKILYYLRNLKRILHRALLLALKKSFEAQEELRALIEKGDFSEG